MPLVCTQEICFFPDGLVFSPSGGVCVYILAFCGRKRGVEEVAQDFQALPDFDLAASLGALDDLTPEGIEKLAELLKSIDTTAVNAEGEVDRD